MALLPMLFCACSSFNEENGTPTVYATTDLQASFAEETRTYVENNKYLRWHEDDRLTAFYGNTLNRQYKFNGKTGANSGTFSLVPSGELGTGNAFDRIYAVYPYNETATITDEGEMSLTLPAVQSYVENSFGKGANTMIAVTENLEDTFLGFKNACGYLKLKLYDIDGGELKSIEIKGNNNEKIAGVATATIAFGEAPQLTMADNATTTVTIDCGDGIAIGQTPETATEFWVVLPEITFTKGLTIKVTDSDSGVFEKSTENEVVITRNEILPMAAVEAILCAPESWKIRYTATERVGNRLLTEDNFGASLVSNEWDETTSEGVITFDGDVTCIGTYAFRGFTSLTSITIPDSVTWIGKSAFEDCTSLTSVTIPDNITSIGDYAFFDCTSLTSVTIPDSVTEIGYEAFYYCKGELIINSKIVETDYEIIYDDGGYSYVDCPSFTGWLYGSKFTKLTIGNNIEKVGDYAFFNCSSIEEFNLPNSITSIGIGSFNNTKTKNLIIPSSVKSIGDYAFNGCKCESITISNGVTSIGDYAFCGSLVSSITIPESVISMGINPFVRCPNLSEINGKFATRDKLCLVIDNKLVSFANGSNVSEYTIPDSVTEIGEGAFEDCTSLTSVTIGNSVTIIGDRAFYDCTSLTSVTIGNGVTEIGEDAFWFCTSLTSITITESVTSIGEKAFYGCSSLKEVYCRPTTPPGGGQYMFSKNNYGSELPIGCMIYVPASDDDSIINAYKTQKYWSDYASYIVEYEFIE